MDHQCGALSDFHETDDEDERKLGVVTDDDTAGDNHDDDLLKKDQGIDCHVRNKGLTFHVSFHSYQGIG